MQNDKTVETDRIVERRRNFLGNYVRLGFTALKHMLCNPSVVPEANMQYIDMDRAREMGHVQEVSIEAGGIKY